MIQMSCPNCSQDIIFCEKCNKELEDKVYETAEGAYVCPSCYNNINIKHIKKLKSE